MPTFVSASELLTPLMPPRTSELLCPTAARKPIAVALVRLFKVTFAPTPSIVLPPPTVLLSPELSPKKALLKPLVLFCPDEAPKNELAPPELLLKPENLPKKELKFPVRLPPPDCMPKKALEPPVVFD